MRDSKHQVMRIGLPLTIVIYLAIMAFLYFIHFGRS